MLRKNYAKKTSRFGKKTYVKKTSRFGKKRVSSKVVTMAVKKYVNRTIRRNVENKVQNVEINSSFGNINQSPSLNMYPITPYTSYMTISQGVLQSNRVGNKIRPVKVMLNYVLRPTPYDATTNTTPSPMHIQMYLGWVKNKPSTLPTGTDLLNLYQLGSSSTPPSGNLDDVISTINNDYWHIAKRWNHKLGYQNYSAVPSTNNYNYTNTDFKLNVLRKMNITQYIPKTITYDDSSSTPTCRGLFFFYQAVKADGSIATATQVMANIKYWISFEYEDA